MRKFIALTGALLLALPGLAFAQVKTQTKGGDWAAQPTAPGDFTRAFKLPQKIGDVTINFRSRVDIDFQSNRNFDFDSKQADSALTPTIGFGGGPCTPQIASTTATTGATVTTANNQCPKAPGRKGEFFEFEDLRFGFDASGDRWAIHTVMEADDLIADREGADSVIHVERWWGDYDFGYFNIRVGNQIVGIEPGAMVWTDDDPVLRLYKDYGTVAWSIYYSKRQDADAGVDFDVAARNASSGAPPGGPLTSRSGIGNDNDVIAAVIEFALPNPVGAGTLSFAPFFVYQDDKRFQNPGGVAFAATTPTTVVPTLNRCAGTTCDGDLEIFTAGATIAGKIWQIDAVISGAYQWGDDRTGLNSANLVTERLQPADIAAFYAFANLAWAIPNTPLTLGAGVMIVSGDDDPFDDKANGYLGVANNTEFGGGLGGIDIWVDEFDLAIKLADDGGPGGAIRTGNASANNSIFLTTDDDPTPTGLSNVAGVFGAPASGIASGSGPSLDPNRHNNRSHPGIIMANANLSYRATKDLLTRVDVNPIWFFTGDGFHPFLSDPTGNRAANIDRYVGTEIVFTSLWRPWGSPYFSINPGVAVLIPGSGIEDLTGTDDIAVKFHVSFIWSLGI